MADDGSTGAPDGNLFAAKRYLGSDNEKNIENAITALNTASGGTPDSLAAALTLFRANGASGPDDATFNPLVDNLWAMIKKTDPDDLKVKDIINTLTGNEGTNAGKRPSDNEEQFKSSFQSKFGDIKIDKAELAARNKLLGSDNVNKIEAAITALNTATGGDQASLDTAIQQFHANCASGPDDTTFKPLVDTLWGMIAKANSKTPKDQNAQDAIDTLTGNVGANAGKRPSDTSDDFKKSFGDQFKDIEATKHASLTPTIHLASLSGGQAVTGSGAPLVPGSGGGKATQVG